LIIGAHLDLEILGLDIFDVSKSLGLNAVQIFIPNNHKYPHSINEALSRSFKERKEDFLVVVHTTFEVFPSVIGKGRNSTILALVKYLTESEKLGVEFVVTHIGPLIGTYLESVENVVDVLKTVLGTYKGKTNLLLENSAGGGKQFASNIPTIGEIIEKVNDPRLGLVYDTAHGYANGDEWTDELVEILRDLANKKILRLIHFNMNDLKSLLGKHFDRHSISIEERPELKESLLKILAVKDVPLILERGSMEAIKIDTNLIKSVS